ncbi:Hypothetical predicted protein [Podarcis lilfordi]|uniref:Uncharacterized protein n=1 Tax=Podarcis lilfordi TaxID=74358 RepID=A0AA35KIN7_9SAUR|nr:Hypothetical predicted protein [Podarcis lilfordi]
MGGNSRDQNGGRELSVRRGGESESESERGALGRRQRSALLLLLLFLSAPLPSQILRKCFKHMFMSWRARFSVNVTHNAY